MRVFFRVITVHTWVVEPVPTNLTYKRTSPIHWVPVSRSSDVHRIFLTGHLCHHWWHWSSKRGKLYSFVVTSFSVSSPTRSHFSGPSLRGVLSVSVPVPTNWLVHTCDRYACYRNPRHVIRTTLVFIGRPRAFTKVGRLRISTLVEIGRTSGLTPLRDPRVLCTNSRDEKNSGMEKNVVATY